MDAHIFRTIANELVQLLSGARVEKIHGPLPDVFVFTLFARGHKLRLVTRHGRQAPLMFFASEAPANPMRPSGAVMRLRKYCSGRRLGRANVDFNSRSIAFSVAGAPGEADRFLLLDAVNGVFVVDTLPDGFGLPPVWPLAEQELPLIDGLCSASAEGQGADGIWRAFPVLTPFLRQTLAELEPMEGRALVADLELGSPYLFVYADTQGRPAMYSAWPLPEGQMRRYGVTPLEAPFPDHALDAAEIALSPLAAADGPCARLWPEFPVLALISLVDEPRFFSDVRASARREEAKPLRKETKKAARLASKLDQEEKRLRGMLALREDAKALQAVLWRYGADDKFAQLAVPDITSGEERTIVLDPAFSVRDNMARMFKQSARGARGLRMLAERRGQLAAGPGASCNGAVGGTGDTVGGNTGGDDGAEATVRPAGLREMPELQGQKAYKGVARFVSSDGFTILRGKNAVGNQSLLKIGKGHDLWLHAEGGPSAHALIRRSHAAEDIPETTLREAAYLVGEKSWQKGGGKAHIMIALLKHVHPVGGARPGTVKVDSVLRSISIPLTAEEDGENPLPRYPEQE